MQLWIISIICYLSGKIYTCHILGSDANFIFQLKLVWSNVFQLKYRTDIFRRGQLYRHLEWEYIIFLYFYNSSFMELNLKTLLNEQPNSKHCMTQNWPCNVALLLFWSISSGIFNIVIYIVSFKKIFFYNIFFLFIYFFH